MSNKIVHLNEDVTRQISLLESFQAAANILNGKDILECNVAPEYKKHEAIELLASCMVEKIKILDSYENRDHLLKTFKSSSMAIIYKALSDFSLIDTEDPTQLEEQVEYKKSEIIEEYRGIAIVAKLLPAGIKSRYG